MTVDWEHLHSTAPLLELFAMRHVRAENRFRDVSTPLA